MNNEDWQANSGERTSAGRDGNTNDGGEKKLRRPRINRYENVRDASQQQHGQYGNDRPSTYGGRNNYSNRDENSYGNRENTYGGNRGGYGNREGGYDNRNNGYQRRDNNEGGYGRQGGYQNRSNYGNSYGGNREGGYDNRNNGYQRRDNNEGGYGRQGGYQNRSNYGNSYGGNREGGYDNRNNGYQRRDNNEGGYGRQGGYQNRGGYDNHNNYQGGNGYGPRRPMQQRSGNYDPNAKYSNKKQFEYQQREVDPTKPVRLNKYLANAGICSRREADNFIQAGVISVNGVVASELGTKVLPTDKIMFHEQPVRSERKVYLLLNKPKDCVTTAEDTHARQTVLDVVKNACSERIYPVGRLDRNTTGVLLLTNDGDLAAKLTHPKFNKKKIYHATLDRPLEAADYETIMAGTELDDGEIIKPDALELIKEDDNRQIGIEIHSGQNRVVRRIFEKVGYKVIRLDRVFFAGLTKKKLPRGKYRFLTPREVNMLLMGAFE